MKQKRSAGQRAALSVGATLLIVGWLVTQLPSWIATAVQTTTRTATATAAPVPASSVFTAPITTSTPTATITPTAPRIPSTAPVTTTPPLAPARLIATSQTTFCGPTRTTGTVRNDGATSAMDATVVARILKTDGTVVTVAQGATAPSTIGPGGTASFELRYPTDVCDGFVLRRGGLAANGYKGDIAVSWSGGASVAIPLTLQ